jgi:pyruvate ferredoxin oxidoreductase alpha subunit
MPKLVVVAMGSVNGTIKDVIDEMRAEGILIGLVSLVTFRPFPIAGPAGSTDPGPKTVIGHRQEPGRRHGRAAGQQHRHCAAQSGPMRRSMQSVIVGLGGRPVTKAALHRVFRQAVIQPWEGPHFLDLNERVIAREIHRKGKARRSGPSAENMLKLLESARRNATPPNCRGGGGPWPMNEIQKLKFYQKGTLTVGNRLIG